jgi:hypothetical protein
MSSKKESPSKDEGPTVKATERRDVAEVVRDNTLRIVDEMAGVQPQFSQSISNLQLDYIQSCKNMIQNAFSTQKQVALAMNIPVPVPVSELFAKQSTEITNNVVGSGTILNQLTINMLNAARENVKIYNRTADAVSDFNNNLWKAWSSFWSSQQQQFLRAQ